MAKVRTTINFDETDYEAIKAMAEDRGYSAAQLIREGCEVLLALREVTAYDNETIAMLREKYPRMSLQEIVRELMFQWRLRSEGGNSKDNHLVALKADVAAIAEGQVEDRALLTEIHRVVTTTTTTEGNG